MHGWTHGWVDGCMMDGWIGKQGDRHMVLVQDHWISGQMSQFGLGPLCLLTLTGHVTIRLSC